MEGTKEFPPTLTPNPSRCCRDVYKHVWCSKLCWCWHLQFWSHSYNTTNTNQSSIVHDFTCFTALNFRSTHFHFFDDRSKYITIKPWYTFLQILRNIFKMEMDKCIRKQSLPTFIIAFPSLPWFYSRYSPVFLFCEHLDISLNLYLSFFTTFRLRRLCTHFETYKNLANFRTSLRPQIHTN